MSSSPRNDLADLEPLAVAIGDVPLAFVDVETTGLSPRSGHRVCEIAIVRRIGDRVIARYSSLINPGCPIDPRAAAVNRITSEMVRDAPGFCEVEPEVSRLLDGAAFVAHNASFDRGFLRAELLRIDRELATTMTIDTLALARAYLGGSSHGLDALARSLRLPPVPHRALGDVEAMCGVFDHLVARLGGWSTPLHRFVAARPASPWLGRRRMRLPD